MRKRGILIFSFVVSLVSSQSSDPEELAANQREYSRLWGKEGELWSPSGRIADFSFAGFGMGKSIPNVVDSEQINVREGFGAVGDGMTDDTKAFLDAVAAQQHGVIFVPPGRYKITRPLILDSSNVVLRGAGQESSILYFPEPLIETMKQEDVRGDQDPKLWATMAGYLWVRGPWARNEEKSANDRGKIADIVARSSRGQCLLKVSDTSKLKEGQSVLIEEEDPGDDSLWGQLHGDEPVCCKPNLSGQPWLKARHRFLTRISSVGPNAITCETPLYVDIRPEWNAAIYFYEDVLSNIGIENLSFEFPQERYIGHHLEEGRNAILFSGMTANCWVRQITIRNAEIGIGVIGSRFITIDEVVLNAEPQVASTNAHDIATFPITGSHSGHLGVWLVGTQGVLVKNIRIDTTFVHDLSLRGQAHGNVFSNIAGIDVNFDHHRNAPHDNLFSNIDVGGGSRLWESGGPPGNGPHSGASNTYWNIHADRPLPGIPAITDDGQDWGPAKLNVIGFRTTHPSDLNFSGRWFESIAPERLFPQDLHQAQTAVRFSAFAD